MLFDNHLYSACVHCYYYACIQLMLYILCDKYQMTQQHIEKEQKNSSTSFHNWIIGKFRGLLQYDRNFSNKITQLKKFRIEADYYSNEIQKSAAELARQYARDVEAILQKSFGI
ncbi:MAG: hypothetical protein NZ516_04395 [Raineya sp.]|nr:hypothetical protein [Raineya sp.]